MHCNLSLSQRPADCRASMTGVLLPCVSGGALPVSSAALPSPSSQPPPWHACKPQHIPFRIITLHLCVAALCKGQDSSRGLVLGMHHKHTSRCQWGRVSPVARCRDPSRVNNSSPRVGSTFGPQPPLPSWSGPPAPAFEPPPHDQPAQPVQQSSSAPGRSLQDLYLILVRACSSTVLRMVRLTGHAISCGYQQREVQVNHFVTSTSMVHTGLGKGVLLQSA